MPHYKDGTPATVGDVVRGKGYNIKDPETGELAEIIGTLLYVNPTAQACNVQVAVVRIEDLGARVIPDIPGAIPVGPDRFARCVVEYGQADHFEKV